MSLKIKLVSKENDYKNECTTYWLKISGTDFGTGVEFHNDVFGIIDQNGDIQIIDSDGAPLTEGDVETIAVRNSAIITDEMVSADCF